ncbi:ABC transporter ATP-binding protein [Dactylosporangium sucinum]|uniref:Multidrug ABC transporter ATP-binding protein n=1 Tax=Dactylosporangium sucinum TaxID=1424081 RepID=A0A917TYS4_9ACTN|nr:ABC transporter ATP-binding protein [Dactylosporangium sucinum]GGM43225.1 multidrug ABC transporter ATP-binding protein [Dactylosporangium sucinum]
MTEPTAEPFVDARNITVRYGDLTAVDGVDLSAAKGQVVGLIGPNGAGKTSLLECVEGLRKPTTGTIRVGGFDPAADRTRMTRIAGVQLQQLVYPPRATVEEMCRLFASFYPDPADHRELLDRFGLSEQRRSQVVKLSGGQQQRLSLVLALLNNPQVVFLDELTNGLDPAARRVVWDELRRRNDEGLTVVITSHHMEEVEYLCDRVDVLLKGRVVASGTPTELIRDHAGDTARLVLDGAGGNRPLRDSLTALGTGVRVQQAGQRLLLDVQPPRRAEVDRLLADQGCTPRVLPPSLDDAYLNLTGQAAGPASNEADNVNVS